MRDVRLFPLIPVRSVSPSAGIFDLEECPLYCSRGGGLRRAIIMREDASGDSVPGWQCLQCGDVIDPVIEMNRKGQMGVSGLLFGAG